MQERMIQKGEDNQRLNKYLNRLLPHAGSGFLYKMLRKKNITLNGKKAEGNELLKVGDRISIFFSDETFYKFSGSKPGSLNTVAEDLSFGLAFSKRAVSKEDILYEDDGLIVAYKPFGVLSQKNTPDSESINEQLLQYLVDTKQLTAVSMRSFRPGVCNRLDRNTSGLILFAKSLPASQAVHSCLKNRSIDKFYFAFVFGHMLDKHEDVSYLTKNADTNRVTISKKPLDATSSEIHTIIEPVAHSKKLTIVRVELLTGKSHQIRAVLQSLGHPILGDPKYMDSDDSGKESAYQGTLRELRGRYHIKGQQLVAYAYRFHEDVPEALEHLRGKTIRSLLPKDFENVLLGEDWGIGVTNPYGILEI